MAAELFIEASLLMPLCDRVVDNEDGAVLMLLVEELDIGWPDSEERGIELLAVPLLLSSPGPSIQARRRFFLSNLLSTFECEGDVKDDEAAFAEPQPMLLPLLPTPPPLPIPMAALPPPILFPIPNPPTPPPPELRPVPPSGYRL